MTRLLQKLSSALAFSRSPSNSSSFDTGSSSFSVNASEREFERDLASKLEHPLGLLLSSESSSCVSPPLLNLPWFQAAMSALVSTDAAVKAMVPSLCLPISSSDPQWLEDYLDHSAKLLDSCNLIKDALADLQSYQLLVRKAIKWLNAMESLSKYHRARASLAECLDATNTTATATTTAASRRLDKLQHSKSRLESCSSALRSTSDKLAATAASHVPRDATGMIFMSPIYGSRLSSIFVCSFLTTALCFKPQRSLSLLHCNGQYLWSLSLLTMDQMIKEDVDQGRSDGFTSHL